MSEYAYLLAKIRGKLARMVAVEALAGAEELSPQELGERLKGTSYAPFLTEEGLSERPTDALRRGLLADIAPLLYILKQDDRKLITDLLSTYRLENIKLVLRYYLREIPKETLAAELFPLPWEKVDFGKLAQAPSLEAFIASVPWPAERAVLTMVHDQAGDKQSPFPYEISLDALYLRRLISYWRARADIRPLLGAFLRRELFLAAFRLHSYGFSCPEIVNLLPKFDVILPDLREIIETEDGWRRLARYLDSSLAAKLTGMDSFDLEQILQLFNDQLVLVAKRIMITSPLSIGIVVGYIFLKELELKGLIGVWERARG